MPPKAARQRMIIDIVETEFVSTQAELADLLRARGIDVTQATISRDVTELRLVRLPNGNGQHRYRAAPLTSQEDVESELEQNFRRFVRNVDRGGNIVVVATEEGYASGVAFVLDKLDREELVGTLAGQNCILVIGRTTADAEMLEREFEQYLN